MLRSWSGRAARWRLRRSRRWSIPTRARTTALCCVSATGCWRRGTLEAFYFDLFRDDIAVPPDFIHHTAQVILRGILDGTE